MSDSINDMDREEEIVSPIDPEQGADLSPETPAEASDEAAESPAPGDPGAAAPPETGGAENSAPADNEAPVPEETSEEAPGETEEEGSGISGIRVATALCDRVMETVGTERFHGGIRPDNISVRDDLVHLGGTLQHGVGEFTPQELEYMAPELFWDGIRSSAADVYSIGLVLYSIYNYGRLPFWPSSGAITPNARASALQKRMSDETIVPPVKADAELSAVILRALAFRTEDRWANVAALKEALLTCDENSSPVDISLAMSGLLTRNAEKPSDEAREEAYRRRTYFDDKELSVGNKPRRRRSLSWLWIAVLGALIVGALILLLGNPGGKGIGPGADPDEVIQTEMITPEPLLTPVPTPEVTPTPEPTERPRGAQYQVYVENVSWTEAQERCRELGGTLAIPADEAEYNEIVRVCTSARLNYVWLGASRGADGNFYTPDGDLVTFYNWGAGEPSIIDSGDGVPEDYLLLWRNGEVWVYNDSRENPLIDYGYVYGNNIGFVCKMW